MRTVKAEVTSSEPISLSKDKTVLSLFATSETGAKPDVSAYLRRAAAAFEELVAVHREIKYQRKISQEQKDDGGHRKMKEKEADCEADSHGGNSLIKQQHLGVVFNENLGSVPVDANGVIERKKLNGKEEESGRVGDATESNGIVENKKTGKKERKMELNKDEKKGEEMESYGVISEGSREKKERKQKEASEMISGKRKKRKHSDAEYGRMNGETRREKEKKMKKR